MDYKLELENAYKRIQERTEYTILDKFTTKESADSKLAHWNMHLKLNHRIFMLEDFQQKLSIINRLLYDPETRKLPTDSFKETVDLVYKELNSHYDLWEEKVISIKKNGKVIAIFTDSDFN